MATGSASDVIARLQRWLPTNWFPTQAGTRIYSQLSGFASVLASVYSQYAYAKLQTRIATATDGFLDLISQDFFGGTLPRNPAEMDGPYSARIRANLLLPAACRPALILALQRITGNTPRVIYPWNPGDVGAYGYGSLGYSAGTGCYGSLAMPAQCFVDIAAPTGPGAPSSAQILQTIAAVIPAGTVAWTDITGEPSVSLVADLGAADFNTAG